jgi:small subunit ribosomal protein S5e
MPHSAGRYAQKRFRKAQCPIIERLTNSLMMNGRNNGKKLMAVRIVAHAFEIVRLPHAAHRPTVYLHTIYRSTS